MSATHEPPLVIRLRCRSCPNDLPSAFARQDPLTDQATNELLIGGRWVSDDPAGHAPPEAAVVCLACGSSGPNADVFEVPPGAADAERNRHLIVAALAEALRLSERARERAGATGGGVGSAISLGQLREMHERITHLLAEGAERGYLSQALRDANARIGEILETTRRECRRPRGGRRSGNGA